MSPALKNTLWLAILCDLAYCLRRQSLLNLLGTYAGHVFSSNLFPDMLVGNSSDEYEEVGFFVISLFRYCCEAVMTLE
jgi:hypothetical protein